MSVKDILASRQAETRRLDAWQDNYRRGVEKTTYMGAGAGALLIAGTLADRSFSTDNYPLRGVFLAAVLGAGLLLGISRILYEQASDDLTYSRACFETDEEVARNDKRLKYPHKAAAFSFASILLMLVAAFALIVAAFWPSAPECTLKVPIDAKAVVCER